LVKFQEYWVKKRCKPGRGPYRYRGVLLRIPKKFHGNIEPFLGLNLNVRDVRVIESIDGKIIDIVLMAKKE
jgi:hypothetical protein